MRARRMCSLTQWSTPRPQGIQVPVPTPELAPLWAGQGSRDLLGPGPPGSLWNLGDCWDPGLLPTHDHTLRAHCQGPGLPSGLQGCPEFRA